MDKLNDKDYVPFHRELVINLLIRLRYSGNCRVFHIFYENSTGIMQHDKCAFDIQVMLHQLSMGVYDKSSPQDA